MQGGLERLCMSADIESLLSSIQAAVDSKDYDYALFHIISLEDAVGEMAAEKAEDDG